MLFLESWGKIIHEKNLKQIISWHCTLTQVFFMNHLQKLAIKVYDSVNNTDNTGGYIFPKIYIGCNDTRGNLPPLQWY
jgi:hypothetical protein